MKLFNWLCFGCFSIVLLFCNKQYVLENSRNSKEAVIADTISIFRDGKMDELEKILLSRKEHNEYFWPYVGDRFHNDKGISADIAYDMMMAETSMRAKQLKLFYEGKDVTVQNIKCTREVEKYGPFDLYLGCNFDVIKPNGENFKERTINGVICHNNQCKLYHLKD